MLKISSYKHIIDRTKIHKVIWSKNYRNFAQVYSDMDNVVDIGEKRP